MIKICLRTQTTLRFIGNVVFYVVVSSFGDYRQDHILKKNENPITFAEINRVTKKKLDSYFIMFSSEYLLKLSLLIRCKSLPVNHKVNKPQTSHTLVLYYASATR